MKILCLGNVYIKEDSIAKSLLFDLKNHGFDIIMINTTFELIDHLKTNENFAIIDAVKGLEEPRLLTIEELKSHNLITSHDFDAGFVLKLFNKNIPIIGIPVKSDKHEILPKVIELLKFIS